MTNDTIKRMTKPEALTAMREGKKVTREYFSSDEYIWMDDQGVIRSEEGYNFIEWWDVIEPSIPRSSESDDYWSIYIQEKKGDSDEHS